MEYLKASYVVSSLVYTLLGLAIFWISFVVVDRITPYKLWQEICEKQNLALAVIVSAVAIGISLIIASAIH